MPQVSQKSIRQAFRDWFSSAPRRAAQLSGEQRAPLTETLRRARQEADAAETLWSSGHLAEGFRLATTAFRHLSAAVPASTDPAEGADTVLSKPATTLAELGLSARQTARLMDVQGALSTLAPPTLDREVSAAHADLYERMQAGFRTLERSLLPRAMSDAQRKRARLMARAWWALWLVAFAVAAFLLLRQPIPSNAFDAWPAE